MKPAPAVLLSACVCAGSALAQTPVAELGKQRAAASPLRWEVREAGHPALGPIVFAVLAQPVSTPVIADKRISSNVYVSCERSTAKMAIELTNGTRPDDPGGLKPKSMPRLACIPGDGKPEDIEARWTVNDLGDAMARGLWPSTLRACASIAVTEELLLPAGWGASSARVRFEIGPYARELDTVFARCGEPTAYPVQAAPRAPTVSTARPTSGDWIAVRVTAEGRTNVRAKPDIHSPLVIRLDPGDIVLVQRSTGDWWHTKSRPGARNAFEGYIRRDRLVVK